MVPTQFVRMRRQARPLAMAEMDMDKEGKVGRLLLSLAVWKPAYRLRVRVRVRLRLRVSVAVVVAVPLRPPPQPLKSLPPLQPR